MDIDLAAVGEKPSGTFIKRELERKSQDRIRVHNPTSEDYVIYWDSRGFTVKAGMDAIFPRYLAEAYIKYMADHILVSKLDEITQSENNKRSAQGQPELDPQQRERLETKWRSDNPALRMTVIKQLWKGIEERYGDNYEGFKAAGKADRRSLDEKLLSEIESSSKATTTAPVEDLTPTTEDIKKKAVESAKRK